MILKIDRFIIDTESGVVLEKDIAHSGEAILNTWKIGDKSSLYIEDGSWEQMLSEYGFVDVVDEESKPPENNTSGGNSQWKSYL